MLNAILSFIIFFVIFFFGLKALHGMTKKRAWSLTKYIVYGTVCSVLALGALTFFVLIF